MSEHEERGGRGSTQYDTSLRELAGLFLKLGFIAFGGPAAHIAMMEEEVVRRRRWLSREEFLDLLGATNLIPGPNSTELAIHIGHRRAGYPGLAVAGSCFILPAALIVTCFAWAYVRYGSLPQAGRVLYGVKPVIIAVVLQALWGLWRSAAKTKFLAAVGLAATVLSFLRVHELLVLFGAGAVVVLADRVSRARRRGKRALRSLLPVASFGSLIQTALPAGAAAAAPFGLWPLFLFFLKVGSVLFGSGYVLLAFLRGDLVDRWHWLTNAQLLDAIAVGQVTPGPVFTTATFIGYVLAGPKGAGLATLGIFLPAFFFVAVSGPLVPRLRRSRAAGAFLDGVNVGSLALMIVVTFELGRTALVDWLTVALACASALLLIRFRVNSAWLVLGGALVGLLTFLFTTL
jgi:chromate transporter